MIRRVVAFALRVLVVYILAWHLAFAIVFVSRGDHIDLALYLMYLRQFLFGRGLEIPTEIQALAIVITLVYGLVRFAFRAERSLQSPPAD